MTGGTSRTSEAMLNPFEAAAASVEFSIVALHIAHCASAESNPTSTMTRVRIRSKNMRRLFMANPIKPNCTKEGRYFSASSECSTC